MIPGGSGISIRRLFAVEIGADEPFGFGGIGAPWLTVVVVVILFDGGGRGRSLHGDDVQPFGVVAQPALGQVGAQSSAQSLRQERERRVGNVYRFREQHSAGQDDSRSERPG